jgi:hypothetical protein
MVRLGGGIYRRQSPRADKILGKEKNNKKLFGKYSEIVS